MNFSEKIIKLNDALINEFNEILLTNKEFQTVDCDIKPNEVRILR